MINKKMHLMKRNLKKQRLKLLNLKYH